MPTLLTASSAASLPLKNCGSLKAAGKVIARTMNRSVKFVIAAIAMTFGQQVLAQDTGPLDQLVRQDARLAEIAERLLAGNRQFCRLEMPLTGMVLHSRDQYSPRIAGDAFTNGSVAVAAVVPDSPAAEAGIQSGDGLAAVAGNPTAQVAPAAETPLRDTVLAALASQAGNPSLELELVRGGRRFEAVLAAPTGCQALVEIKAANSLEARSDGRVIQVDYGLAAAASDLELAAVFAHELAHLVLEHRRRLEAAGVEKGFFGEFGKNQRLNRQVEVEADRMAVHLLANAGYDPAIAPAFWRTRLGRRAGGGLLRSRTYPSPEARASLVEREIADYLGGGAGPSHPGHLLSRRNVGFD